MRSLVVSLATLVLAACGSAPARQGGSPAASPARASAPARLDASTVDFLLTATATDFHAHRPPDPARFRNVRIGHQPAPGGETRYLLCGEFLPAQGGDDTTWTPFVTIRTSGYELMIGAQAAPYCESASVVWETTRDLSNLLLRRYASLP